MTWLSGQPRIAATFLTAATITRYCTPDGSGAVQLVHWCEQKMYSSDDAFESASSWMLSR